MALSKVAAVRTVIPDGHPMGFDLDSMGEGWGHVSVSSDKMSSFILY